MVLAYFTEAPHTTSGSYHNRNINMANENVTTHPQLHPLTILYYYITIVTVTVPFWCARRQKQAHSYTMLIYTITVSGVQYKLLPTSVKYVHVTLCTHSSPQPSTWEWRSGGM